MNLLTFLLNAVTTMMIVIVAVQLGRVATTLEAFLKIVQEKESKK